MAASYGGAVNSQPPPEIVAVIDRFPRAPRQRLLQLRKLLLQTASRLDGVGEIEECLRWGQPSYLTSASRSGSMVRLHWSESLGQKVGLYVHCQTRLISEYRARYPEFEYEGKRGLLIPVAGRLPRVELADCMSLALTYRLRGK